MTGSSAFCLMQSVAQEVGWSHLWPPLVWRLWLPPPQLDSGPPGREIGLTRNEIGA